MSDHDTETREALTKRIEQVNGMLRVSRADRDIARLQLRRQELVVEGLVGELTELLLKRREQYDE